MSKNIYISLILSFLVTGLGNIYNGLILRGLIEFIIGLLFTLLGIFVAELFMYIGTLWALYVLYDTYQCTNAINNNEIIPKFLTLMEL